MSVLREFEKDPAALLDFVIDYSAYLKAGETISSSSWTLDTGITLSTDSKTNTTTTAWIEGGEHGRSYRAVNTITTNQGRRDERSIALVVREQ